jgi:flagellar biosynthesis protein FliQ
MMINMLFMTTVSGVTSLVEDRVTDFTQEMMISPISRYSIVIGKILGSSFGAIIGMFGTIVVGLIISIFQATTQIQEQTLTFVPKLIGAAVVGLIAGPWMLHTVVNFTQRIFALIANIVQ